MSSLRTPVDSCQRRVDVLSEATLCPEIASPNRPDGGCIERVRATVVYEPRVGAHGKGRLPTLACERVERGSSPDPGACPGGTYVHPGIRVCEMSQLKLTIEPTIALERTILLER